VVRRPRALSVLADAPTLRGLESESATRPGTLRIEQVPTSTWHFLAAADRPISARDAPIVQGSVLLCAGCNSLQDRS
jgi:hypothetical protein